MLKMKLFLTLSIIYCIFCQGEAQHCMSTDCTSTGYQHGLSLYLRVCCEISNLGQTVTIKGNGTKYILCPKRLPKSCPAQGDCQSWYKGGYTASDVYTINPDEQTPFEVYCDMETNGGGWTVFQRRQDGSVDFYKYWTDYEDGFGNLNGEFWLGLSKINRLTKQRSNTLRVDLKDFDNNTAYAQYSTFNVGNSTTKYTLTVGGYSGTAGDGLITDNQYNDGRLNHNGMKFSTRDSDNDGGGGNCAITFHGAWWNNFCFQSHLNALYSNNPNVQKFKGIMWYDWKGNSYSLKFSEMKFRRNN